jgi:hypothetical protein
MARLVKGNVLGDTPTQNDVFRPMFTSNQMLIYQKASEKIDPLIYCGSRVNPYHQCTEGCKMLWMLALDKEICKEIKKIGGATPGCGGEIYEEAMKSFKSNQKV